MNRHETTWATYTASWKAKPEDKRALFASSLSEDCVYTDPLTQVTGWDGLLAYMAEFERQFPGGHFVTVEFLTHNDRSMARWEMCDASGTRVSDGVSYGEYDSEGQLITMTGFFETPEG